MPDPNEAGPQSGPAPPAQPEAGSEEAKPLSVDDRPATPPAPIFLSHCSAGGTATDVSNIYDHLGRATVDVITIRVDGLPSIGKSLFLASAFIAREPALEEAVSRLAGIPAAPHGLARLREFIVRPVQSRPVRLAVETLEERLVPDTVSWVSSPGGFWAVGDEFSNGVPRPRDAVTFTVFPEPSGIRVDIPIPFGATISMTTPEEIIDQAAKEEPLALSRSAFKNDLPELLVQHRGQWVAYADGSRVKFARTQAELYRYCLTELGLTHDRFIVRRVVPDTGPEIDLTPR